MDKSQINVSGLKLPPKRAIKLPPKRVAPVDNGPKEWFYHDDDRGADLGPYSVNGLRGRITRDTLVWMAGLGEWKKAAAVPELAEIIACIKPELPPSAISDKWFWCLASLPLTVPYWLPVLLQGCNRVQEIDLIVTWVLNIIFITLDIKALKKAGRDIERVLWLGLVLVPVYMFVRAAKYTKRYGAPIVWCVLFMLSLTTSPFQIKGVDFGSLFSSRVSSSELSGHVIALMNEEYHSNPKTKDKVRVTGLTLVHDEGNRYSGVATIETLDGYLWVAKTKYVIVTYDGSSIVWQLF